MHVTKRIDLPLLEQELTTAGVPINGLGHQGTSTDGEVYTYTVGGDVVDLPPEAAPVVAAHIAPPLLIEYAETAAPEAIVRTTDDVPLEVFRLATVARSVYRATFQVAGIDAGSGAARDTQVRILFKRPSTTVVHVGATAVITNIQDTAAASWSVQGGVDGTDFVISVRGAAGRTIDWLLQGTVGRFAPEGL